MIISILLPITLMSMFIATYTYLSRLSDVDEDLVERGNIFANAIAEGSEYGISSGNTADLERIIKSLVNADSSISYIDILDAERKKILHIEANSARVPEDRTIEVPILKKRIVLIDPLLADEESNLADAKKEAPGAQLIGYVKLKMSPSKIIEKQKQRVFFFLGVALGLITICIVFALFWARGLISPLLFCIESLRNIGSGKYETRVPVTGGGEIGDLQISINKMAENLQESTRDLENKVQLRTQELEASRNEALKSNLEKQNLIHRMNTCVEDERKNIAGEIHDELNAKLIKVRLNTQEILTAAEKCEQDPSIQKISNNAIAIIDEIASLYESTRTVVRRMRPEILDMVGLQGAIDEMVRNYQKSNPTCNFWFVSDGDFSTLPKDFEITVYRLIQEALSNILKYAEATKASVCLKLDDVTGEIHISIIDDGKGFDTKHASEGFGILGMRERVFSFNGKIELLSAIGEGTEIYIHFSNLNRSVRHVGNEN